VKRCEQNSKSQDVETGPSTWNEMEILSKFKDFHQKKLLAHPLVETYLHLKWITTKKFLYINIFLYVLYLLSLTVLVTITAEGKYKKDITPENVFQHFPGLRGLHEELYSPWLFFYSVSFVATIFICIREVGQLINERSGYFKSGENILEMTALASTWTYLVMTPFFIEYEAVFGAVAMFCAWLEMTLMLGRIPSIGKYTYMSTQVIQQLLLFFSVYSTTLIAFSMAFYLLLVKDYAGGRENSDVGDDGEDGQNGIFDNPWTAFLKVLMLMIGEYDFSDTFRWNSIENSMVVSDSSWLKKIFPLIPQLLFIFVLVLVTIIIGNLITGLTVNNIGELSKHAEFFKLGKTLKQIKSTEEFVNGKWMKLLKQVWESFWKTSLIEKFDAEISDTEIKICIQPNKNMSDDEYISKKYDVFTRELSKIEDLHIPSWIVKNTFDLLREKEKMEKALDVSFRENTKFYQGKRKFTFADLVQRKVLQREKSITYQESWADMYDQENAMDIDEDIIQEQYM